MLSISELFCCCVLRQFLLFVEVFWSEMFVFFLDFLLSVSVKFLFLCVCVCVCICLSVSYKKAEQIFIQFSNKLYCAISVDTQYTFLLWNSPPLNWVSFIIFEKVPIEKPSSWWWWWWWGPNNTLFRSSSSIIFLDSRVFSLVCLQREWVAIDFLVY
jgi:hypothetical protein